MFQSMSTQLRRLLVSLLVGLVVLIYNEYFLYYLVLGQCRWPSFSNGESSKATNLRVMVLADTHLLGPRGHWFDRLRREWQMERTFQTALHIHRPEVVFILGDIFDEAKWTNDQQFQEDVTRFKRIFRKPSDVSLRVLVGNHDVGYHYMMDERKLGRFDRVFETKGYVRLMSIKGTLFVAVNSMAFEGDGCKLCRQAEKDLMKTKNTLACLKEHQAHEKCGVIEELPVDLSDDVISKRRPILLQHYPMYRASDENCMGTDAVPEENRYDQFKPRYDCLSKEASDKLIAALDPQLILTGHTHHYCNSSYRDNVEEIAIPSFSWRNKKGSSFMLAMLSGDRYWLEKCYMPDENTVVIVYFTAVSALTLFLLWPLFKNIYNACKRSLKRKTSLSKIE